MATDVINFDVNQPVPTLNRSSERGIYAVAWRDQVPLGAKMVLAGTDTAELREWLEQLSNSGTESVLNPRFVKPPQVTVAICTHDRPAAVRSCLAAIRNQQYPHYRILVVDNGEASSASLKRLCKTFAADYAAEPKQGVVHARNRALAESDSELIAYLDDDCTPTSSWLDAAAQEFTRSPSVACCTGPILPTELETPAQELLESRGGFSRGFAHRVYTEHSEKDSMPAYPVQAWLFGSGANMIFRRRTLEQINGFDPYMHIAEDLDIFYRILRAGHNLVYSPAAVVRHAHVRKHSSLRKRFYRWGSGYMRFLAKVALEDSTYRSSALREMANWFYFQLRHRAGEVTAGFPADLYAAELLGGLAGAASWLVHCRNVADSSGNAKVRKLHQ